MNCHLNVCTACCLLILLVTGTAAGADSNPAAMPGAVTMLAIPFGSAQAETSFFAGDTIMLTGTNTGSGTTYLFLTGPNLPVNGSQIQGADPRNRPVIDGNASTFQTAGVGPDNRWSWSWDTKNTALDPGTYTLFAVSSPRDKAHLAGASYETASIIMAKPLQTAKVQPRDIIRGESVTVSGTIVGTRQSGIAVWVIGPPSYAERFVTYPDPAGSFSLEINGTTTDRLDAGAYRVVVQDPGTTTGLFDIFLANASGGEPVDNDAWVWNRKLSQESDPDGRRLFQLQGQFSLRGDDAYEALLAAFADPDVDDMILVSGTGQAEPLSFDVIDSSRTAPEDGHATIANPGGDRAAVTIDALTKLTCRIGEETVTISGTNTASGITYLSLTGPNMRPSGSQIQSMHPAFSPVIDDDASTFQAVRTGNDNRWSYTWDTRDVRIDSGTYTVYAAAAPRDRDHLNKTRSARISFVMLPPEDTE